MLLLQVRSGDKITLSSFIKDFGLTRPRADAGDFKEISTDLFFVVKQKKKRKKKRLWEIQAVYVRANAVE